MTKEELVVWAKRLGVEAWDRVHALPPGADRRSAFLREIEERMRQLATVVALEGVER